MRKLFCITAILSCLVASPSAYGQGIQINRQNRTISVQATETVEVEPEIAEVTIAYVNFAATQDAAYNENVRTSAKIIQSLLGAGLNKQQIQTSRIELVRQTPEDEDHSHQVGKEREFKATQTWDVRVAAAQAQAVGDRTVTAGANQVQKVDWTVADRDALEAKANVAALNKAQSIARQMATQLGGKVGELLYASNSSAPYTGLGYGGGSGGGTFQTVSVQAVAVSGRPILRLFPQKVTRRATVYAVFALD